MKLDHLVFAAPDLDDGVATIESLFGVRPVAGGRHPQWGTRNALISLGPSTYLEVIAPDPEAMRPVTLFGLDRLRSPRLVTWAASTDDISRSARAAAREGVDLGPVSEGSRLRGDGALLSWSLTDPFAERLGGTVPFLIDWGTTPHPSASLPQAGRVRSLRVSHPDPDRVRGLFEVFGLPHPVVSGPDPGITAVIDTASGRLELR